jgi:hypothetical protein
MPMWSGTSDDDNDGITNVVMRSGLGGTVWGEGTSGGSLPCIPDENVVVVLFVIIEGVGTRGFLLALCGECGGSCLRSVVSGDGEGGLLGGFPRCWVSSPLLSLLPTLLPSLSFLSSPFSSSSSSSSCGFLTRGEHQPLGCGSWLCEAIEVVVERDDVGV